jgi:hypothetical protein
VNGAIYTTNSDGTTVNGNIYDAKSAVYLTGGPQNKNDPGLSPTGSSTDQPPSVVPYYFQVTDPSGAVLLSNDPIACRVVLVQDGRVIGADPSSSCQHVNGVFDSSNGNTPVQLCFTDSCTKTNPQDAFADTPNPGGEYKAWLTPVADYDSTQTMCWRSLPNGGTGGDYGFCDSDSKTDNFKVRMAQAAYIVACKFDDANGDGYLQSGEDLLVGWNITANGVAAGGSNSTTETLMTDETGCVSFTVLDLNGPITLTEQNQTGWIQTAPNASGVYDGYTGDATGTATATTPLTAGQTVTVYFGNNNLASEGLLTFSKTANPTVKYTWGISKSVDKTEIDIAQGGSATFTYTVSVTHDGGTLSGVSGDITLSSSLAVDVPGVAVADTIDNGGTCTIAPDSNGVANLDGTVTETVPAGGTIKLHYVCTFTSPSSLSGKNTVTLTQAGIQIGSPQTATYSLSGATIVDGSVTVTDPFDVKDGGTLGTVSSTDPSPTTFTYSHTFTGDPPGTCTSTGHTNTATFTTNTSGTTGSDTKTVKVCVGADLTVSKTATPSFTRTYKWTIAKNVDRTKVEQFGGTATFNYEVDVTSATPAYVDSGWQVGGSITVSNPNDWEAITASVSDALSPVAGSSCVVTGGDNNSSSVKLAAGGSATLSYTCTGLTSGASGANTATATWDAAAAHTKDGSASNPTPVPYAFTIPTTEVNKTINVTDTFNGVTTPLGTVTYPGTGTFKYPRTVNVPISNCLTYPNTAKITQTGQTAGASIEVCGPAATGALTMGFWQNKNGQGIITGGASTSGVCNSGTYLQTFAPFQDLSASANCSAVATYVYNVIKGGGTNCGGATCNAMLKAQMLATALDVYFGGGSGGNPLGAPKPIGGVTIDLTMICPGADAGSITGCENASGAFGGASSLTVSQMLSYAAGKSNVGGTTWYGNVKTTQVLAKDAFDAINNQRAFSP